MKVVVKPKHVEVDETRAKVKVKVGSSASADVTGAVKVRAGGRTHQAVLEDGKIKIRLSDFGKTGKKKVLVQFVGDEFTQAKKQIVWIKVRNN